MTQWQYQTIISIIQYGAPALSNVLIECINQVLQENEDLKKEKSEEK